VPIPRLLLQGNAAGTLLFWLDTTARIGLFVKLKLTKCAPIPGLPGIGFFMPAPAGVNPACAAGNRAGFFMPVPAA
jgi:hypothetical protein